MPLLNDFIATARSWADGLRKPDWPTVDAAAASLFDSFDTDADGVIEVPEVVRAVDPSGRVADEITPGIARLVGLIDGDADARLTGAEVAAAMQRLDTNDDGHLSPADLGPALARGGLAPLLAVMLQGLPQPPAPPPEPPEPPQPPRAPTLEDVVATLVGRFDADDDDAVTLAELLAVLDPSARLPRLEDALARLVAAVDRDDDGAMQIDEIVAAVTPLDADGNGRIDPRDHLPGPPADGAVDLIGVLLPRLRDFDAATLGHHD